MKISPTILVGVQYKRLCDYYHVLHEYIGQILKHLPELNDQILFGLSVYKNDDYIIEKYYIGNDIEIKEYVLKTKYSTTGDTNVEICEPKIISYNDMKLEINKNSNVLDMNYFISNN